MLDRPLSRFAMIPLLASCMTIGVASSGLILLSGCSDNREGNVKAKPTVKSIKESREEIVEAKSEIGKSLVVLNQLIYQVDLKKSFSEFSDILDNIKDHETDIREQQIEMEKNNNEYIKEWQLETAQFSNDELKKSAIDRQAEVKKKFAATTVAYKELDEIYVPFIRNLTEIHTELKNDLTPASTKNVKPIVESSIKEGEKVQSKADELIMQLDDLNASLSSVTGDSKK